MSLRSPISARGRHTTAPRRRGLRIVAAFIACGALISYPIKAIAAPDPMELALNLASMLRSARTVIANNQKLINEPSRGNKGFTGQVVVTKALENFRKRLGADAPDIDADSLQGRLLRAQISSIVEVVDENQSTINKPDVGFKGFVLAVFARLVNESFQRKVGREAEIKVTAPLNLVRNRKARPDAWEKKSIRGTLSTASWPHGRVFSEEATNKGRKVFRVLVPEYYGKGCLSCHGEPRGKIDVTGYPMEGGKEGHLAGDISITLYR
jgi:hypothetical protein